MRIAVVVALAALMLGLVACKRGPQPFVHGFKDSAIAVVARDLARDAATEDPDYFTGLTPERESIPVLMRRVARSGIATNYADHLSVETPDAATLAYRLSADDTTATSFAVKLRLIDGKVLVEQILMGEPDDASMTPATPTGMGVALEGTPVEIGSTSVSVSIESDRLRGYDLYSALIGFTNTSHEGTSVPLPLDVRLRITDRDGEVVPDELHRDPPLPQVQREYLPPLATIYSSVRFIAPKPGKYEIQGQANGVWSSGVKFESTR